MDEQMRVKVRELLKPLRDHAAVANDQAYKTIATTVEHAVMAAYDGLAAEIAALRHEPLEEEA